MRRNWRPFIQPDNAIRTNRNGSRRLVIAELALSPPLDCRYLDLPSNLSDRVSGRYGLGTTARNNGTAAHSSLEGELVLSTRWLAEIDAVGFRNSCRVLTASPPTGAFPQAPSEGLPPPLPPAQTADYIVSATAVVLHRREQQSSIRTTSAGLEAYERVRKTWCPTHYSMAKIEVHRVVVL